MDNKFYSKEKFLDFKDVLILPQNSELNSRSQVNMDIKLQFNNNLVWSGVPIIAANMTTTGTLKVYNCLSKFKIITALHKFHKLEDLVEYNSNKDDCDKLNPDYFAISTGISDNDYENLVNILDNFECKFILIDIANGYISNFEKFCKKVRDKYKYKILIAGNVSTKEGVIKLASLGVDIIKLGIGGGSACTTRIQTGIGMPQLSCILEGVNGLEKSNNTNFNKTYILSDGGITCPGDCSKAFSAGAKFVMIGGEFSGHDENPGEIIEEDGKKYKFFYGMSSSYAMKNNYSANNNTNYRSSEGRELKIPYKGKLEKTVENYLGGIRSTCSYTNSINPIELYNNAKFIMVNNQFNAKFIS